MESLSQPYPKDRDRCTEEKIPYKSPASRLWAEREIANLHKRITTLIKQYNIVIKRNAQLAVARKRYDLVTVEKRKARTTARIDLYRKVDVLWRAHESCTHRRDICAKKIPAQPEPGKP